MLLIWILLAVPLAAQPVIEDRENPFAGDAQAIEEGRKHFVNACAGCHGATGEGGRGPQLRDGRLIRRSNDLQVFRTIQKGVPGTDMPGSNVPDAQIWKMVAFVRALGSPAAETIFPGDAAKGERLYAAHRCTSCHAIAGQGGALGPDLSNAGGTRSYEYLRESVVKPAERISQGFAKAVARTKDGRTLEGIVKNYSNYDVQLLTREGALYILRTTELADFTVSVATFMPLDYAQRLSRQELTDLVAYLAKQTVRPVATRRSGAAR